MWARLGLLLAVVFAACIAYLTALNPSSVRIALAPRVAYEAPLMALVVGAFLIGASVSLFVALLRDIGRSFRAIRRARLSRQPDTLAEIYQRGVDAQLAGNPDSAALAYREVIARSPDHLDAHMRLAELARARGDHQSAMDHHLKALRVEARGDVLLALAQDYDSTGRNAEALATYRQVLDKDPDHRTALRAVRRLAAREGRWAEGLSAQETLVRLASAEERRAELEWLAGIHYEIGKALVAAGRPEDALPHFRESLRTERRFLPAALALGDAHERTGDRREAIRTWERAAEITPALPVLERLERAYREEGRPTRMIALYQDALARLPEDLLLAFALGRVFFELEMLDEAADQFQKVEVTAPDFPPIHAYLGAISERRGRSAEAFAEYRRALHLTQGFEWPHACGVCGSIHPRWQDRCPACGRWNTSQPSG